MWFARLSKFNELPSGIDLTMDLGTTGLRELQSNLQGLPCTHLNTFFHFMLFTNKDSLIKVSAKS